MSIPISPSPVLSPPGAGEGGGFAALLETLSPDNCRDATFARQLSEQAGLTSGSSAFGDVFKTLAAAMRSDMTGSLEDRMALYRAVGRLCDKGDFERKRFGEAGICELLARRLETLTSLDMSDPEVELVELLDCIRFLARDADNAVRFYDQGVLAFAVTSLHCHSVTESTELWCAGVRTLRNVACDIPDAVQELVIVLQGTTIALECLQFGPDHRGLVHAGLLLMDSVLDIEDQMAMVWEGGGLDAMVVVTNRYIHDADIVSTALENLIRLAKGNDEYRRLMPERGVCGLGMSAIAHCYKDKEVVDLAVELMLLLGKDASPTVKSMELEALVGDIARLKGALRSEGSPLDEEEVLGSLAPISYYWVNSSEEKDDVSRTLLQGGELPGLVVRAITACPHNAAIQAAASQLLFWLLTKDPLLCSKLGDARLIETLIRALDEHRQVRATQKAVGSALMRLGSRDERNRELIKLAWAGRRRREPTQDSILA